jgi:short-subunit dehydrogenase
MRFFIQLLQSNNNKSNINFYYIAPDSMRNNFIKKIKIKSNYFSYDASEIAKTSLKDILQNKTIIIPGFLNKFFVFFIHVCL